MAAVVYCALADLQNLLSADGVSYRVDDTPPETLGDVLDDASRMVDEHCLLSYTGTNLAVSSWVRHRCSDIAAYLLCERRGNPAPPGIAMRYERTMERLEKVRLGSLLIADIPARKDAAPAMSNVRVRLDPFPRSVVERSRSSKQRAEGYRQDRDILDFFVLDYSI